MREYNQASLGVLLIVLSARVNVLSIHCLRKTEPERACSALPKRLQKSLQKLFGWLLLKFEVISLTSLNCLENIKVIIAMASQALLRGPILEQHEWQSVITWLLIPLLPHRDEQLCICAISLIMPTEHLWTSPVPNYLFLYTVIAASNFFFQSNAAVSHPFASYPTRVLCYDVEGYEF